MSGKGNSASGKAGLKPVYEGYFSKIFWKETNETVSHPSGELSIWPLFGFATCQLEADYFTDSKEPQSSGYWELAKRIKNSKEEYQGMTNATSQVSPRVFVIYFQSISNSHIILAICY